VKPMNSLAVACAEVQGDPGLVAARSRRGCRSWIRPLLFGWGLVFIPATMLQGQGTDGLSAAMALEQSLTQLIEQSEPSVVSVARYRTPPGSLMLEGRGAQPGMNQTQPGRGELLPNQFSAGVIVAPKESDERYILTVYHAVRGGPTYGKPGSGDGSRLEVRFFSRHVCPAEIIAADPRSDLAVLRLDLKETNLRPAALRPMAWNSSPAVRKGQLVITLGNPYWIARDGSPSAGWAMVANLGRRPVAPPPVPGVGLRTLDSLGGLIHLDTRLPIGSSGAPVVNLTGQLVGLTTSLAAVEGYERSSGFALPLDSSTSWIVEDLLAGYEVEYGFLGIAPLPAPRERLMVDFVSQPSAALAGEVHALSPAHAGGLLENDIILAVNGQPTLSDLDLMRQVTLHPPDAVVNLTVLRRGGGAPLTLAIKLGKWPAPDDQSIIASKRKWPLWRGLGVDYPTGRSKFFVSDSQRIRPGVLITEVQPGTSAEAALLEPGTYVSHVHRTPVRTPAEFTAAVAAETGGVSLRVIAADDTTRTVTVAE